MSDETKADLEAAIAAHIADESDGALGAWILLAEDTSLIEYDQRIGSHRVEYGGGHYAIRGLVEGWLDVARRSEYQEDQ